MIRRVVVLSLLVGAAVCGLAVQASAHPLGNVSVNIHNGIVVSPEEVRVTHVVDLAEVPTVQAMPELDADDTGSISSSELAAFSLSRCSDASRNLSIVLSGAAAQLVVRGSDASIGEGQAGLATLRIECTLSAPVSLSAGDRLEFQDDSASSDIGWREVTLQGDVATVTDSDVPEASPSQVLTSYPQDQISSPPRVLSASAEVSPGGAPLQQGSELSSGTTPTGSWTPWEWGAGLLGRVSGAATSPPAMVLAVLVALVVGAAHALAPGHGKSLVAFALAGRQERAARAAFTVGVTVTAAHTFSVLALGLIVASTASVAPGAVYRWIETATALLVVALGLVLLRRAVSGRISGHQHVHDDRPGHQHGHPHPHGHLHPHDHGHDHPHEQAHEGAVATLAPVERGAEVEHGVQLPEARRGVLVTLGLTGGLLPSPSAVVVLLAAVSAGRAWFGVVLVLAFGAGMALTLATVGFAVVSGQARLLALADRSSAAWAARLVRLMPAITASCVLVLGLTLLGAVVT